MPQHARLFSLLIGVTSLIGLSAGLLAAESSFRLEEATIAEIQEAVTAGALSSERLVELGLLRQVGDHFETHGECPVRS
jgi:hypothetical protein